MNSFVSLGIEQSPSVLRFSRIINENNKWNSSNIETNFSDLKNNNIKKINNNLKNTLYSTNIYKNDEFELNNQTKNLYKNTQKLKNINADCLQNKLTLNNTENTNKGIKFKKKII